MPSEESNECDKDRKYKSEREIDGRAGGGRKMKKFESKRDSKWEEIAILLICMQIKFGV